MSEPLPALPPDVQLALENADRQVRHAQDSRYKGRVEIVMTVIEYNAMRTYIYGAAKNTG